jgi:hypothetical protein
MPHDEVVKVFWECLHKHGIDEVLCIGTIGLPGMTWTCFACGKTITSASDVHHVRRNKLGPSVGEGFRDPPREPGPAPRIGIGFKGFRVIDKG